MKQKRVLIECHSLLGDLVLMIPMIKELKKNRPDLIIDMVIASKTEECILALTGVIDKCYIFQPSKMSIIEIVRLIMILRRNHYEYGFVSVSENPKLGAVFLKAAGCKYQIGESSKSRFLNYNCAVKNDNYVHRVERNINLLCSLDIKPVFSTHTLVVPDGIREWAEKTVSYENCIKIVTLCLGTGDFIWKGKKGKVSYNCKQWGYENFFNLTIYLLDGGYKVIWVGGQKEQEEINIIQNMLLKTHQNFFQMVGRTNILETLGLLDVSDLVIGADTGLMHCAAALKKRTLCIIGSTDPAKIRPYSEQAEIVHLNLSCSPCYGTEQAVYCENRRCLNQISVDMVAFHAQKILANSKR